MINSNVSNQPSSSYLTQEGVESHIVPAQAESSTCHSAPRNDTLARSLQEATSLVNHEFQNLNTRAISESTPSTSNEIQETYLMTFLKNHLNTNTPKQIDRCIKKLIKLIKQKTISFCKNNWKEIVRTYLRPDTTGLNFLEILELEIFILEVQGKFINPLLKDALVQFLKEQGLTLDLKRIHKLIDEAVLKANKDVPLKTGFIKAESPEALIKVKENKELIDKVSKENEGFVGIIYDPKSGKRLCEGVMISPDLFLTTGHYSISSREFITSIGIDFNIKDENEISLFSEAEYIFGSHNSKNDFAIFHLKESSPRPSVNSQNQCWASLSCDSIDHNETIAVMVRSSHTVFPLYSSQENVEPPEEPLGPGCSGASQFNLQGKLFMIHSYMDNARNRFGPTVRMILDCLYKNNQDIYNELRKHHDTLPEIPSFLECSNLEEDIPPSPPIDPRTDFAAYKKAYQADPNFYWNYVYEIWTDKELLKGVEDGSIRLNDLDEVQAQQYERARTTNQALLAKENNEKQEFINNLKTQLELNINNSNYNPLTKSFKSKHFASLNSAKQNAQNRKFQQETATKRSTLIEDENIKRLDWINEIKNALEGLRPEHLDKCGKNFRVRTTGRGRLLPETTKPYDLKVNMVTKSKNKNDVSNTQILRSQKFNFSIQINAEGLPQINHFSADGN